MRGPGVTNCISKRWEKAERVPIVAVFKTKARIQVANLLEGTRPSEPGVRPRKHKGVEVRLKGRGI